MPKHTNAGTEYRELCEEDRAQVLSTCVQMLTVMSEYDARRDEDSIWVRDQWWHKRSNKVHKGQHGPNSPCSVIGGIVYNMMYKDPLQRDFSSKQLADIEYVTAVMNNVYDNIPAYRFQVAIG